MKEFNECRKIYQEAFGVDEPFFENLLFETCFEYCKTIKLSGETAAMLFALPCNIKTEQEELEAIYIYAAATKAEHRKKGLMQRLINEVQTQSNTVLFLRPANEGLISYYEKLGFKRMTAIKNNYGLPLAVPVRGFATLVNSICTAADNSEYIAMYYSNENFDLDNLNFIYSME